MRAGEEGAGAASATAPLSQLDAGSTVCHMEWWGIVALVIIVVAAALVVM
jgi:hypothetical protein